MIILRYSHLKRHSHTRASPPRWILTLRFNCLLIIWVVWDFWRCWHFGLNLSTYLFWFGYVLTYIAYSNILPLIFSHLYLSCWSLIDVFYWAYPFHHHMWPYSTLLIKGECKSVLKSPGHAFICLLDIGFSIFHDNRAW